MPDELAEIVLRLMAKDPSERFGSAAETAAALAPFAKRKTVSFDWDQILATRSKYAQKRNAAYRRSRTRAGRNTTVTMGMLETAAPNRRADASGVGAEDSDLSVVGGQTSSMLAGSILSGAGLGSSAGSAAGGSSVILTPADATPGRGSGPGTGSRSGAQPQTGGDAGRSANTHAGPPDAGGEPAADPPSGYGGGLAMSAGSGPVATAPPPSRLVPEPGTAGGPLELTRGRMLLGRQAAAADLTPALQGISGRHCEFVYTAAGWKVRDLNSRNGTAVHSVRVTEAALRPGDLLTLAGGHHYRLEVDRPTGSLGTGTLLAAAAAVAGVVGGVLWWWFA